MTVPIGPTINDALIAAARAMLGPDVAVAGGRAEGRVGALWPEEEEAVARAIPARRQEFAAGRAAARRAMAELGLAPVPLPRRPDGPPRWPDGVTGSLTHGGGQVLAAVGRLGPGLRALGLDLEPDVPLPAGLAAEVCRPDEDASQAIQVFGAKEAAYKAQFTLTGQMIYHADLRIRFDAPLRFTAEFARPVGEFAAGTRVAGQQALIGALLLSAVRIGRGDAG